MLTGALRSLYAYTSEYHVEDGYYPLEALCAFGSPTLELLTTMCTAGPAAALTRAGRAGHSALHLLLNNSASVPDLRCLKYLCHMHPLAAASVRDPHTGCLPSESLARRVAYLGTAPPDLAAMYDLLGKLESAYAEWRRAHNSLPAIFYAIRLGTSPPVVSASDQIKAVEAEVARAMAGGPGGGVLSRDPQGRSVLHVLCRRRNTTAATNHQR